jgi:hypothetical protein
MGIEIIFLLVFAQLIELSELLRQNAALVFFLSLFLVLSLTGAITTVRRWRGE